MNLKNYLSSSWPSQWLSGLFLNYLIMERRALKYGRLNKIRGKNSGEFNMIRENEMITEYDKITELKADTFASTTSEANFDQQFITWKTQAEQQPLQIASINNEPYNLHFTMQELTEAIKRVESNYWIEYLGNGENVKKCSNFIYFIKLMINMSLIIVTSSKQVRSPEIGVGGAQSKWRVQV